MCMSSRSSVRMCLQPRWVQHEVTGPLVGTSTGVSVGLPKAASVLLSGVVRQKAIEGQSMCDNIYPNAEWSS